MLKPDYSDLPAELALAARTAWANIEENLDEQGRRDFTATTVDEATGRQLARVLACSPFFAGAIRVEPRLLLDLLASGELHSSMPEGAWRSALLLVVTESGAELMSALRRFRRWHMLRIVWRDFCRLADTLETIRDTSLLADACIDVALQQVQAELELRFGVPIGRRSGAAQHLIVVALGKLGAGELNVSSDIDLMFAYPEAGETTGAEQSLSNEEFFTRAGRGLIAALDQVTGDGFVFRVDMRLRPYGESGALVHNFNALESYYQEQGRDWERYALIKARPVTGGQGEGRRLMAMLRPFVYRRYVDFGVIESLRSMKQMIAAEVRRRGLGNNVKLGSGGIREVEFIAQCIQLIRGGRERGLQQRELLPVLAECAALGSLPSQAVEELRRAYLFLRDSEHAIQGYEDRQSQELPANPPHQLAMAFVMGFPDWDTYSVALEGHRRAVAAHFAELIADPDESDPASTGDELWREDLTVDALSQLGFKDAAKTLAAIEDLLKNGRVVTLQEEGSRRFEQFMPLLLRSCAQSKEADLSLARMLPIVLAVVRRSAYLVLLMENRPALDELALLCGVSPWIAEQMAAQPVLLDELLDRASLYTAPDRRLLEEELQQQVARIPVDDLEAQMEALRYFKASHVLRVAASELADRLPLMQVSDKLTWIAEVIVGHVLHVAWNDLVRKYGEPLRDGEGMGFTVFAYGKMGGIELSYASDLDLVFIQDSSRNGVTSGERSIDNAVFYTRLAQRMIHILETRMTMGQLYEVDMRLRPSGASGMLVTTLDGFRSYQNDAAWTWEHQALVRARYVAGDETVASRVSEVRDSILCRARDEAALAGEVVAMRNKMREHSPSRTNTEDGEFDLKQDPGGIVDIEFMVQYAVLAWSHREPELARWSDNVRILETLGRKGLFEQHECDALTEAYIAFRSAAHQLALQQQPGIVPAAQFVDARASVSQSWHRLFAPQIDNLEAGETE